MAWKALAFLQSNWFLHGKKSLVNYLPGIKLIKLKKKKKIKKVLLMFSCKFINEKLIQVLKTKKKKKINNCIEAFEKVSIYPKHRRHPE